MASPRRGLSLDYDELASAYAAHRVVHPEVLRRIIVGGELAIESRVLEVGCGTGNYAGAVAGATGCRCVGVDPSVEMLSRAKRRYPAVEFQAGEAGRLDFEAGSFDLVFSVDVIHHVQDRARAFHEACRVLRDGGRICTVTDSPSIIRNRRPLAVFFPESVEVDLARYPATSELETLMDRAGFEAIGEEEVELSYVTSDIGSYRAKAFSCLHLISESAYQQGMARLARQSGSGGVRCVSRYMLLWGTRRTSHRNASRHRDST
jgi:SAM-dependent methyltransferase